MKKNSKYVINKKCQKGPIKKVHIDLRYLPENPTSTFVYYADAYNETANINYEHIASAMKNNSLFNSLKFIPYIQNKMQAIENILKALEINFKKTEQPTFSHKINKLWGIVKSEIISQNLKIPELNQIINIIEKIINELDGVDHIFTRYPINRDNKNLINDENNLIDIELLHSDLDKLYKSLLYLLNAEDFFK